MIGLCLVERWTQRPVSCHLWRYVASQLAVSVPCKGGDIQCNRVSYSSAQDDSDFSSLEKGKDWDEVNPKRHSNLLDDRNFNCSNRKDDSDQV